MTKVAIIGAGLSGLSTAHLLKDYAKVFLFEKARGVSGRMSTRRAETYFFDHGAQYFTARTQPFKDFLLPLLNSGVIKRWNPRYVIYDDIEIIEQKNWANDEPRYVGVPGMNAVTQSLADSLNVNINTKISSIQRKNKWELKDETGRCYDGFDWIISKLECCFRYI